MRLSQYLVEGRGKSLTLPQTKKLLQTKHSNATKKDAYFYRGFQNEDPFKYVNPADQTRKSANAQYNYYTMFFSNFPSWSKYPKRDNGLICSTSKDYASDYGAVHRCYPMNGAPIGVCPEDDIWNSFKKLAFSLDDINYIIHDILEIAWGSGADEGENWSTLKKQLGAVTAIWQSYHDNKSAVPGTDEDEWKADMNYDFKALAPYLKGKQPDFLKYLNDVLAPEKHGFKLIKSTGKPIPRVKWGNEVWVDTPLVMIKEGWFTENGEDALL